MKIPLPITRLLALGVVCVLLALFANVMHSSNSSNNQHMISTLRPPPAHDDKEHMTKLLEEQREFERTDAEAAATAPVEEEDTPTSTSTDTFTPPAKYCPFCDNSPARTMAQLTGIKLYSQLGILPTNSTTSTTTIRRDRGRHLITTFFVGTYAEPRVSEIMSCLVANLENPHLEAVHVLWEQANPLHFIPAELAMRIRALDSNKLVLHEVKQQPTYQQMFRYANNKLLPGSVAIVSNADVYFDHTVGCITLRTNKHGKKLALALSRRQSPLCHGQPDHNDIADICVKYSMSHDMFAFAVPMADAVVRNTNHAQNAGYGAENIVIYELKQAGYQVMNPCLQVRGYHHHCANERHYKIVFVNRDPPRPGWVGPVKRKCEDISVT